MLKNYAIVIGFGVVGWALCGLIVAVGMSVTSPTNALITHAV